MEEQLKHLISELQTKTNDEQLLHEKKLADMTSKNVSVIVYGATELHSCLLIFIRLN